MCGIAALQLRNPSLHPRMGSLLSSMLCQIVDRGPDSAGLAVYNTPGLVSEGTSTLSLLGRDQGITTAAITAGVVARAGRIVPGVGGTQRPVVVLFHQEVLHLGAHLGLHALLRKAGQGVLQYHARGVGPGRAVDMGVAVDDGQALLDEGHRGEGIQVRHGDQVRVLWLLPHQACGEAGEAHGPFFEVAGGFHRDQFGAGLAGHVHEGGQQEADAVGPGDVCQGNGGSPGNFPLFGERQGGYSRGCDTGHRNVPVRLVLAISKPCCIRVSKIMFRRTGG